MKRLIYLILFIPSLAFAQVKSDAYLNTEADTIKNETVSGKNTQKRIARMVKNLISSKLNKDSAAFTLTTTGTGAATYSGGVLNIPNPSTSFNSTHVNGGSFYNVTNTSAFGAASDLTYQIIGNVVHVYGFVTMVASGSGAGEMDISFPVSTTISQVYDVAGTGIDSAHPTEGLEISGDVANNRIRLKTIFLSSGSRTFFVTFMYKKI